MEGCQGGPILPLVQNSIRGLNDDPPLHLIRIEVDHEEELCDVTDPVEAISTLPGGLFGQLNAHLSVASQARWSTGAVGEPDSTLQTIDTCRRCAHCLTAGNNLAQFLTVSHSSYASALLFEHARPCRAYGRRPGSYSTYDRRPAAAERHVVTTDAKRQFQNASRSNYSG